MELTFSPPPIPASPRVFAAFVVCFSPLVSAQLRFILTSISSILFFFATFFSACSPHCVPLPGLPILCVLIKNVILLLPVSFFSVPNRAQGSLWRSYITAIWHYQKKKEKKPPAMENMYCAHLLRPRDYLLVVRCDAHVSVCAYIHPSWFSALKPRIRPDADSHFLDVRASENVLKAEQKRLLLA